MARCSRGPDKGQSLRARTPGPGQGRGCPSAWPGRSDAGCLGSGFQVKDVLDEILEKLPDAFNMAEIMAKAAEKTPYVVVAAQECEWMNLLTHEVRRSLKELNLGLKVRPGSEGGGDAARCAQTHVPAKTRREEAGLPRSASV